MILNMKTRGPTLKSLRTRSEEFGCHPKIYKGQEDIGFERILDRYIHKELFTLQINPQYCLKNVLGKGDQECLPLCTWKLSGSKHKREDPQKEQNLCSVKKSAKVENRE